MLNAQLSEPNNESDLLHYSKLMFCSHRRTHWKIAKMKVVLLMGAFLVIKLVGKLNPNVEKDFG